MRGGMLVAAAAGLNAAVYAAGGSVVNLGVAVFCGLVGLALMVEEGRR